MPAPDYVQNWQTYSQEVEGRPAVRTVNLGLRVQAPIEDLPHLLTVWVKFARTDDGQPTEREAKLLARLEDLLEREARQRYTGVYAGHQTRNGVREHYFYCRHTESHAQVFALISAFEGFAWGSLSRPDALWRHYLDDLYPNPRVELTIRNRNTVESLEFFGDPLVSPRRVEHFLYFTSEAHRDRFVARVTPEGFEVVRAGHYSDSDRLPFSLILARTDSVAFDHIDAVVHSLYDLALAEAGEYDGWESGVYDADTQLSDLAGNLLNKLSGQ